MFREIKTHNKISEKVDLRQNGRKIQTRFQNSYRFTSYIDTLE